MATYKQIQIYIKDKYEVTVKDCWIAHIKEQNNLPLRVSHRRLSPNIRVHPCPEKHKNKIEDAFKYFGMI